MTCTRRNVLAANCVLLLSLVLTGCGSRPAAGAADPSSQAAAVEPSLAQERSRVRVPILAYHHVAHLKPTAGAEWRLTTVTPEAFREQMSYLRDHGYESIHIADLIAYFGESRALPTNPVVVTFDDAWDDGYLVAYPILKEHGLSATFFIPANWVGQVDGTLTWEQIAAMETGGMEIGSHSMTHPYLTQSKPDMLTWELQNSKARLEKHVAGPVVALAYPFGLYDDNIVAQAQAAGYRAAVTLDGGVWASRETMMTLPRFMPGYDMKPEGFAALLSQK